MAGTHRGSNNDSKGTKTDNDSQNQGTKHGGKGSGGGKK